MKQDYKNNILKSIAMVCLAMLFFACTDTYKRVGDEAKKPMFPVGVAENFTFTYTEAKETMMGDTTEVTKVIAVLSGPISENFTNLDFPFRTFPEGLILDFYDDDKKKSVVKADYGIVYSATNLIDLQGNVVLESHDGTKLETPQLYIDQDNKWSFTHEKFKYTNPKDGTIMDGVGMDFSQDKNFLYAHKTNGLMLIPDEKEETKPKEQ